MNFDKTGHQLALFSLLITEMVLCNKESHLIFKNLYEFEDLELTDP